MGEILEGGHRALSSGAMRFTELLAWRGRDRAYDRADTANRQLEQEIAESDMARGRQVLADEMADRHITVPHPDDPTQEPIYDGPVTGAGSRLVDGAYVGVDEHGNDIIVAVGDGQAVASAAVDPAERAEMQAQAEATLTGRDGFAADDVDNVLYGWASARSVRGNSPDGYDAQYWRDWAVMEADDQQLADAAAAAAATSGDAVDRIAAAYTDLQSRVEAAARTDATWRQAADRRAGIAAGRLYADGLAQSTANQHHTSGAAVHADLAQRGVKVSRTVPRDPQVAESLSLHDMAFAGREHPGKQTRRRRTQPAAKRGRAARRGTDRSTGR